MFHRYRLSTINSYQRGLWDNFVDTHCQGHFLQSWGWGALKTSAGWHPLRVALWDREREQIVAGAQILRRTVAHMPPRLGHLAYIPRGPVLNWLHQEDSELVTSRPHEIFFSHLQPFLRKQGAIALHVELPLEDDDEQANRVCQTLAALDFHLARPVQPIRTIMLDITPDEETLLAQMKEKWRYNIRLAGRKGVTVRLARGKEDMLAWYRLLQTTGQRDAFGIHSFDYYWRAWQIFTPLSQAQLFLAEYEGQLLAGIFVGCMARQAIYLYGASGNTYRNFMPNYLLQWEAIRWARTRGATSYDFWGIPATDDADEAMAGVYRFKSGWGGRVVRFAGNYEHVFRPLTMYFASMLLPSP